MRILGIDYGDRQIGLALSDPFGWTAQGLEVLKNTDQIWNELQSLVEKHQVEKIVLGWPKNMDGTLGERAVLAQEWAEQLEKLLNLPVILWDERLTTIAAEKTLLEADLSRKKRKKIIDRLAAVFILQNYLDSQKKQG